MTVAELLDAYIEAEKRFEEVSLKAHAVVPGEPLQPQWLDTERLELITSRQRERDEAFRAYRQAIGF